MTHARLLALAVAGVLTLTGAAPGGAASDPRDVSAYEGLGTWVDIYDGPVWRNPGPALARMQARGVTTLYLETANYRQRYDVKQPRTLARIVETAHSLGLQVVAWYLPSFTDLNRDLRRSLAAIYFRTPSGDAFDSFALDIEDSTVRPASRRTARLIELSRAVRRAAGRDYPLGAIIPSPRGMELLRRYWPGFPYRGLRATYDVFLPMGYFSYRTRGYAGASGYTARNVAIIRRATGDPRVPIHAIGGVASFSSHEQVRGFVAAARRCSVLGASLYDFLSTSSAQWRALTPAQELPVAQPARCS
jgi:hypothetical protein